ncbi:RNA dependent RNA polymerase-domain-containing protein [Lenzites betulinus]|nr:RNA dependent RNA polymerase-domain-containing protein [Lenzites betulinus]
MFLSQLPWGELDKEETILRDHPLGGIGCNQHEEFCRDDPDWYGGRVHFIARLQRDSENRLGLELDRPVLGTSNRFARRFGSRRFIRVRIPQDFLMHSKSEDELLNYFKRPFVVGSAVFRAFYAKESNVFLFRTNEEVVRDPKAENLRVVQPAPGSLAEHSYMYLIEWHNSLKLNSEQTMVKWAARFALGLSNSVPGVRLRAANVRYADDIICDAFNGVGKPPSNMQMTDGCGFANRALTRALEAKFPHWREEPTAFQTRIGGAKGLQCVYHDLTPAEEEEPIVWLRPSQIKIKHSAHALPDCILHEDADPALLTIDVLRTSRMNTPARLAIETITNLAENGVPYSYFVSLFKMRLEERLDRLLAFDDGDPKSMLRLWNAIAREGAVINARMTREAAGIARAAGLTSRDYEDELEDEDEDGLDGLDKALREQSSAWWEDPISGCPSGLEETCLTMLDAGFTPQTCPVLRAKLMEVAKKVVTTFRTRYRTAVPMSCSAFIVPDPYGVLGPNEIHVKCSRGEFLDHKGRQTDIVLGDVLVTRHPCKVPSDVQKVKAVFHEKLRHYHNVIVVSTKNHLYRGKQLDRHLASLTGGGDYDGDTMEVFWDPDLVRYFKEPDPRKFAVEPPRVQECLVKNTETVASFLSRVPTSDAGEGMEYKISAMQDYLLGALKGSAYVSTYSIWWEKSTYKLGYSHDETIFLAYMFCAILDGSKTGVTVDPAAFKEHKAKWASGRLNWKDPDYDGMLVKRESGLGKFIMDALSSQVHSICEKERVRIDAHLGPLEGSAVKLDEDLARPYLLAKQHAQSLRDEGQPAKWDELRRIERHVEGIYAKALGAKNGSAAGGGTKSPFTEMPIEKRQDILREQSKEFHAGPADLRCFDDPTAIKASYAYYYDYGRHKRRWSRFPWNVAMRALCEIKAKACGSSKTLSGEFYPWMAISPIYLR